MRKKSILAILLFVGSFAMLQTFGQQTAYYLDPDEDLREGMELFNKEKYSAAQDRFARYLDRTEKTETTSQIDATYFKAICAMRHDHHNTSKLVEGFIETYPESPRANQAKFEMGNYLFNQKKYKNENLSFSNSPNLARILFR